MGILDVLRSLVRRAMTWLATRLDRITNGKVSPVMITLLGFLMHLPIAYLIATGSHVLAAVLLVVFGLFDALDGALARVQNRASSAGMVLDASTDRMKEVLLYMGVGYFLLGTPQTIESSWVALILVAAAGGSLLVSYVKAKGETAVKDAKLSPNDINRLFQDGFLRFELRMFLLIVGLCFDLLLAISIIIAVLSWFTALDRLQRIYKKLQSADV